MIICGKEGLMDVNNERKVMWLLSVICIVLFSVIEFKFYKEI